MTTEATFKTIIKDLKEEILVLKRDKHNNDIMLKNCREELVKNVNIIEYQSNKCDSLAVGIYLLENHIETG